MYEHLNLTFLGRQPKQFHLQFGAATSVFVTGLCAGLHVLWPVGLLTGVIAVTGVPAAVEDGLFPAVGAPLFLFGLVYGLLLFRLHLLLHFGHQPFSFLLQALPHLRHCELCIHAGTKWKLLVYSVHRWMFSDSADGGPTEIVLHLRQLLLMQPLKLLDLYPQPPDLWH